jgi:hypothetical protein
MVGMETNMSKKVFKLMADSMSSDIHRNSLVFDGNQIKVICTRFPMGLPL